MKQSKNIWVLFLLLSSSLIGCLSDDRSETAISLVVNTETDNGTLVESYSNGEKISTTNVSIDFDFSQTSADNKIITYGIDTMDGRTPVTVNANTNSIIRVEFYNHGIYNVSAYAIDEDNLQQHMTIIIRIDLRIEWVESNTHDPKTLTFDPNPVNGGPNPKMIEVNSVVENPSLIEDIGNGGQSVQITWNIIDEQNDVCQKKTTQIEDGDSDNWHTIHFNTFQVHELTITYDDGQDNINVNHSIAIIYEN
ncbi:MAG: hypothetical protein QGI21_03855 [Candidatus Poseidoniaceae archaeon]|jgi:hypothetical protein|nr:hypothetical protein [Candidatus Poseidoniaceae archaeon]